MYFCEDINIGYDYFANKRKENYDTNFKLVRLSRKRAEDKIWVTSGIKQSSKHKNKLYRKWLQSKCYFDEEKYKNYRKLHKRVVNMAKKAILQRII